MEFLKAILGDGYTVFETAINEYNAKPENKEKQVKIADLGTGEYVGKGKYTTLEAEVADLKEQIKTAETTIKTLKKDNESNEALQTTIKTHETTIATMKADYEAKIKDMSIDSAIKAKLTDTKYPDLLIGKFDRGKLVVADDGTVSGIDEQLTGIKETYKELFTPAVKGKDPNNNGTGAPSAKTPKVQELEKIINDASVSLAQRIAAKNELATMKEE